MIIGYIAIFIFVCLGFAIFTVGIVAIINELPDMIESIYRVKRIIADRKCGNLVVWRNKNRIYIDVKYKSKVNALVKKLIAAGFEVHWKHTKEEEE